MELYTDEDKFCIKVRVLTIVMVIVRFINCVLVEIKAHQKDKAKSKVQIFVKYAQEI